jgi:serpin B
MRRLVPALLLTTLAAAPAAQSPRPLARPSSPRAQRLALATNRFGLRLFHELAAAEGTSISISPLSAGIALTLTLNGAAGSTRDALAHTLALDGLDLEAVNAASGELLHRLRRLDPRVRIVIANSIWYRTGADPRPAFLAVGRRSFGAQVAGLDFNSPAAARRINAWIARQTRGLISRVVPDQLPADAVTYLVNAIHFRGVWTTAFDRTLTREHPFRLADGSTTTVEMMSHPDTVSVGFLEDGGVTVVDIPYGRGRFSLLIAMPEEPSAITTLSADLTPERWERWIAGLEPTPVHLSLPRFALTDERVLVRPLAALGMAEALCPSAADFTAMFARGRHCISDVRQSTVLRVSEEGTVAAAATAVEISVTRARPEPRVIVVDRPFVFAVRERGSGAIVFLGRVMRPGA